MKMHEVITEDINYEKYIDEFLTSSGRSKYYAIRDNCGPCALDFIDYMKNTYNIILKRVQGEFYADIPVHTKYDFYKDELIAMKKANLNPNSDTDRIRFMQDNDLTERNKYIPHYWLIDNNNKIVDPSGYLQFVKSGLSKDLNSNRYHLKNDF